MENLFYIPLALLVAVLYKAALNFYYLRRIQALRELHVEYLKESAKPKDKGKPGWEIIKRSREVVQLLQRAGVKDHNITRMRPLGFGHAITDRISVFDNVGAVDLELAQGVQHSLYEAEGVYSQRIRESISLFYWVEAILFLPAKLAQYVGVPAGSWIGRAANIVVWFVIVAKFVFSLPDFQDARTAFSALLAGIGKWVNSLF